ncbi:MAG: hypothetical protein IPL83_00920 [Bdellovibrionales bacterium]|nr:hypothetical protein [Bdellovibrionales bacterium]
MPDTNAQSQAPIFGEGLGEEARANAIPNNGGGFAGGGGGGGGGSMPYSGGGGGYGGPGYETDILKGVGGGGGYSASPLPAESCEDIPALVVFLKTENEVTIPLINSI